MGGEEQRNLKKSQFTRFYSPDMYKYIENGSKNRSGGTAQLNLENKVVQIHASLLPEFPTKNNVLSIIVLR